jgi:DNA-binding NarL/FixJ family response regulator
MALFGPGQCLVRQNTGPGFTKPEHAASNKRPGRPKNAFPDPCFIVSPHPERGDVHDERRFRITRPGGSHLNVNVAILTQHDTCTTRFPVPMKPVRILVVEDDPVIREWLASVINASPGFVCTGECEDAETALEEVRSRPPDIVLMDIVLPGKSGIEGTKRIKQHRPDIDVLILTVHENDDMVFQALCAGAAGYLTKNITPDRLLGAISEIRNGGAPMSTNIARMVVESFRKSVQSPLTPRETEVLHLLSRGMSYTMIADQLFIDGETVRSHIKNIYRKLEVNSKADAIAKATKDRLI